MAGDNMSQDTFNRPNAVAFGRTGNVFVSDGYANQRVVEFTPEGKFVRIFGGKKGKGDGEMAMVHGVAIDAQGRVYATDSDNQRVRRVRRARKVPQEHRDSRPRRFVYGS